MSELTRRRFLLSSSAGLAAAAAGAAAAGVVPGMHVPGAAWSAAAGRAAAVGPVVLHVRNPGTGEVSLMTGTAEVIYQDHDLVSRLLDVARRAGRDGGA